eukprot:scaffold54757_cov71-Phaeocystis_antarctica.AAC.2
MATEAGGVQRCGSALVWRVNDDVGGKQQLHAVAIALTAGDEQTCASADGWLVGGRVGGEQQLHAVDVAVVAGEPPKPRRQAVCRGVAPLLAGRSVAARAASSNCTQLPWPLKQAACRGVAPLLSGMSTMAWAASSSCTQSLRPSKQAANRAVLLSLSGRSMTALASSSSCRMSLWPRLAARYKPPSLLAPLPNSIASSVKSFASIALARPRWSIWSSLSHRARRGASLSFVTHIVTSSPPYDRVPRTREPVPTFWSALFTCWPGLEQSRLRSAAHALQAPLRQLLRPR